MDVPLDKPALDAGPARGRMVIAEEIRRNARDLEQELAWFRRILDTRFKLYFDQECEIQDIFELTPPDLSQSESAYARFVRHYQLSFVERVAVVLALVPHIRPQILDVFFTRNHTFDRKFAEFGGIRQGPEGDFWPTGETLAFIVGGADLELRFALQALFDVHHVFVKHNILRLVPLRGEDQPAIKAPLRISQEYLVFFTTGQSHRPDFGVDFPAQYIETRLSWDSLVLHPGTIKQIEDIQTWIEHGETLMVDWGMAAKLRPGYRSLFYGPPGTGKTMTACLLGKSTGRDVYKVDLSLMVSKYIGETEKNLAKVFDQAQHKGWILFFDEADALFGKRGETKAAHDRYANQEVSFLLQRIETFDGLTILASNLKENLDNAFARRFESMIYFPVPRPEERLRLWKQGFSAKAKLDDALDLDQIARDHVLTGGSIMNIIRYVSLQALKEGNRKIAPDDVLQGIRREYAKEGKAG
ncbi:MAG: ATP-binding protein [Proteobacteria bacterium]|nr:ATP-binding protein [Pseudomonadota bacterium]